MDALFYTLGCKVNQYETQAMMAMMADAGYRTAVYHTGVSTPDNTVIVINSCTVTAESDRKLRQFLRRTRKDNPTAIIVVCGCMPQAFPEAAATLHDANIILGNAARQRLPSAVESYRRTGERLIDITPHDKTHEPLAIRDFNERTRAFVKIEDGCDRFCTYCIIPYARGRVRSRAPEDIVAELRTLQAAGYREVVLVGINLTSYGKDTGLTLADAVDAACGVDGIERVRLGSLEPDHITPTLIERLKAHPKLCHQFHVALQSGCDATLHRMNRHYTTAQFENVCDQLREAFDDCSLTTDVMVGFPGETDENFEQSYRFVEHIGFSKVHVFPYSRRDGTKAAAMPEQLENKVKTARAATMTVMCERARTQCLSRCVGTRQEVLCETHTDDTTVGYTKGYLPCRIAAHIPSGTTVTVTITGVENGELTATL